MSGSSSSSTDNPTGVINGRFQLGKKIGSGSSAEVYLATDVETGEEVAVKMDSVGGKKSSLCHESHLYINYLEGGQGISKVRWFGAHEDYTVMVMDLLGPSLKELFVQCHEKFSIKTVSCLADQMISRLEYCHNKNIIHRDVKPNNFAVGVGDNCDKVYIIDFGLSKLYREGENQHIPFRTGKKTVGTPRYASNNAHLGFELSRRDDMVSLGYTFLYFLRGNLPWNGIRGATKKQRDERIAKIKSTHSLKQLCNGFPEEFLIYLNYCHELKFEEEPDYNYLRGLFKELLNKMDITLDNQFDWNLIEGVEQVGTSVTKAQADLVRSTNSSSSQVRTEARIQSGTSADA